MKFSSCCDTVQEAYFADEPEPPGYLLVVQDEEDGDGVHGNKQAQSNGAAASQPRVISCIAKL